MTDLPEYHDDIPALSPYIAKMLLDESPQHAWTFHRLLGGKKRKPTTATDTGTLFHAALLEDGKGIEVIDAPDFKTKAAREAKADAIASGLLPIAEPKWQEMQPAVERIKENIADAGFSLDGGLAEVKLEWSEPADNPTGSVLCHGRLDWLSDDWTHIQDLKTTGGSVHPDKCAAALVNEGGATAEAAYRSAVERLRPELAGRISFTFLFVETKEPYVVTPIESAGSMREFGESRWQRAIEMWAECLKSDNWPGYARSGRAIPAYAPALAMAREMENAA